MVDYEMKGRNETFITLTFTACVCDESEETASKFTLTVSSMVRNFLLSPISMALLIRGTASFTASSMGTGGMFSPPAVMISSKHHTKRTDLVTDHLASKRGNQIEEEGNNTFNPSRDEEESLLV